MWVDQVDVRTDLRGNATPNFFHSRLRFTHKCNVMISGVIASEAKQYRNTQKALSNTSRYKRLWLKNPVCNEGVKEKSLKKGLTGLLRFACNDAIPVGKAQLLVRGFNPISSLSLPPDQKLFGGRFLKARELSLGC
jgi:hypothetical protein